MGESRQGETEVVQQQLHGLNNLRVLASSTQAVVTVENA